LKDKKNHSEKTINCHGKILTIDQPIVMGIINATPDSFYTGSRTNIDNVLTTVEKYIEEGAKIIDLGAYSSRPDGQDITVEEEIDRLLPILKSIRETYPQILISLDTFRSEVYAACKPFRIDFVNDISAGVLDPNLPELAGKNDIPYIAMHMRGTPQTMQSNCQYESLLLDINKYFSERISHLKRCGIKDIILDPGFGFAKNIDQNFELLKNMHQLQTHKCILLACLSIKSMIYKTLESTPSEALNGTTALHMVALEQGAKILRVHDVKEAVETITLFNQLSKF
jgi:dihydropteroate synthase